MIKKLLTILAVLAMSGMAFVGCSKDKDDDTDNLAEKLKGKWMIADRDGQAALTNKKSVLTFLSATEALLSTSRESYSSTGSKWSAYLECSVAIDGNKVTVTGHPNEHTTLIQELNIHSITTAEMEVTYKLIRMRDGEIVSSRDPIERRYVKVTTDYKNAVLGKWEGHVTSEQGSEFDDGEDHQWEYLADGTFRYYSQDGNGTWVTNPNQTLSQYFVDGTLLCTRWVIDGTENREWWEIASIADGVMNWTALRQREDGTTYTATFQMTKVN